MDSIAEHALYARFLRGLRAFPRRPALRVGTRTVSYEEAHETALRWSGAALAAATPPPRAVGVLTGRSTDAYLAVLAALYTGAAVVPLHAEFPVERTREMLRAAGVSVVLADEQGLATLAATGLDLPAVPAAAARGPAGRAAGLAAPRPVAPDDTAYVLFTSGSTGRPKGVPITHANTAHYFGLMDRRYDFNETDVFSQTFDLNFDCAMFDLFCAWGAGARVQAIPPLAYRDLPDFLTECGMTVWFSTPSVVALSRRLSGLVADSMPTLRWSLFAGEALRQADAEEWQRAASRSTLENIYGPTELTITIAGHRWDPERSPARCVNGLVPIGAVHAGHDHLLLGPDGGVDPTEGELCVCGPQTTPGYLDPRDGEGRFLERAGAVWYRTGDRVRRLDGGELAYLGRLDAQVQVQGWRVELAEVEAAARTCDGVEDAVVVPRSTEDGTELVVFYTGVPTAPAVLARRMREVLPKGMLPREYHHLAEFPLNANRKIDRRHLAGQAVRPD
ncbi:AMP-binding protein [Streptomyces sp. NBC_00669]|uniref:AMP-binding protein n=1 Tax=Streptomyces sp. NBC_00669 TaxID=2976011 RepID=UPI002E30C469|nr:AMP-binding protein [Streptomyces sp. NBC_00669]